MKCIVTVPTTSTPTMSAKEYAALTQNDFGTLLRLGAFAFKRLL